MIELSSQPEHPVRSRHDLTFLSGGDEMGAQIRTFDWASTPLRSPESWPQALKTIVRLMLSTRHPMFIFWGPEHRCLYNDAYSASLGPEKHPAILGAPGQTAWPEIWEIIGPQIELVMGGEGATWHENQLVPIIRHGELQDVYWTYSFGPIDEPTAPHGVGGVLVVCTETTAQVLAERRRGEELDRLHELFNQAPGFMCVLSGPEHRFEIANAAYSKLVGGRNLVGRSVGDAFPEVEDQGFIDLLNQVYRSGESYIGRAQRIVLRASADAVPDERFLDFVYQPIRDEAGAVTGIFCEGSDVTDHVRAEAERRALLDMLAHDLKTPLTSLKAQAQLLRRQIVRRGVPDAKTLIERVVLFDELSNRMTDQITELSEHARLVLGEPAEIDRQPTDLVALVGETITELYQTGGPHLFQFTHETESLFGSWDPRQLRRVAANLLGNAVKYSPNGGDILIHISVDNDDAVLRIEDAGIGIPKADLSRIFAFRSRGSNVASFAGSGIGLAGVKRIVEQHDGSISVASEEGRGSTFTIRLPLMP